MWNTPSWSHFLYYLYIDSRANLSGLSITGPARRGTTMLPRQAKVPILLKLDTSTEFIHKSFAGAFTREKNPVSTTRQFIRRVTDLNLAFFCISVVHNGFGGGEQLGIQNKSIPKRSHHSVTLVIQSRRVSTCHASSPFRPHLITSKSGVWG